MSVYIPGVRPTIVDVNPYVAGKTIEEVKRELGLTDVVKLGSNENPYAPFPEAMAAMQDALSAIHTYPENSFVELRHRIGSVHGLSGDHVAISHGAGGMLETIARAFIQPGDEVVMLKQSYGLYREISRFMGAEVREVLLNGAYRADILDVTDAITEATKIVWLCNPNNPTGTVMDSTDLTPILDALPPQGWLIMDEAYAEFSDDGVLPDIRGPLDAGKNIIVIRTFSKAYGLAGARMGYALAAPPTITAIDTVAEPFNANRVGIAGATAVLGEGRAAVQEAIQKIRAGREYLESHVAAAGSTVTPTQTNFVFFELPRNEPRDADVVVDALLHRGVIVRSGSGWGYPRHVRVTVGTDPENKVFLRNYREVLNG
ncbi:MAG: histidinol-phosphate transaminase [Alkalispirochaeta sp.]